MSVYINLILLTNAPSSAYWFTNDLPIDRIFGSKVTGLVHEWTHFVCDGPGAVEQAKEEGEKR